MACKNPATVITGRPMGIGPNLCSMENWHECRASVSACVKGVNTGWTDINNTEIKYSRGSSCYRRILQTGLNQRSNGTSSVQIHRVLYFSSSFLKSQLLQDSLGCWSHAKDRQLKLR